jgi:hypothetical protein
MKLGLQIPDFTWPGGTRSRTTENTTSSRGRSNHWLAGMGVETVIGSMADVWRIKPLEIMGERVIPAVANLEAQASPAR